MARCTAPINGHRTASGRANCPVCGGGGYRNWNSYPTYSSTYSSSVILWMRLMLNSWPKSPFMWFSFVFKDNSQLSLLYYIQVDFSILNNKKEYDHMRISIFILS